MQNETSLRVWRAIAAALLPIPVGSQAALLAAQFGFGPKVVDGVVVLPMVRGLFIEGAMIGLPLMFAMQTLRWTSRDVLGTTRSTPRVWIGAIGLAIGSAAFGIGGSVLLDEWLDLGPPPEVRFQSFAGAILVGAIVAPVLEEALYRGCVLRALRERMSAVRSVALSAALFAFIHLDFSPSALGLRFFVGCMAGWLFVRTGSLVPCIAAHSGWNLAGIAIGTSGATDAPRTLALAGAAIAAIAAAVLAAGLARSDRVPHAEEAPH